MKRGNVFKFILGIILICVAVIFVGNSFGAWNINGLKGWWALIIVAVSVAGMISDGVSVWNSALAGTGIWLFMRVQKFSWITTKQLDILFAAFILVIIGVSFIFGAFQKKNLNSNSDYTHDKEYDRKDYSSDCKQTPHYFAFLSENRVVNSSQDFRGGSAFSLLGSCIVDLTGVNINGSVDFDASCCLGSVTVIVPRNVRVIANGTPILGDYKVKAPSDDSIDFPVVNISGTAILGSVEII